MVSNWTKALGIGRAGWEKFWNFDRIFLEEQGVHKKMVHDYEFGWGRYDRNKPKCSEFRHAPMNSNWTKTLGTSQASWEKIWKFERIFLEEQRVLKKNGTWFQVQIRDIWSKQAQVLRIRTCSYELQLNWSFGETSLPSFIMMWTTRELVMMTLQNELHTHTTLDHRWTYTRLKNRSSPKGGHGGAIRKKIGCMWYP